MRKIIALTLLLCLAAGNAVGGDYIRLGVDSIGTWPGLADITFYFERTCPEPALIMGTVNGFVFTATGDVVWEYAGSYIDQSVRAWFIFGILRTVGFDGVPPDTFELGGASMPPTGMPVFDDRFYFSVQLHLGGGEGEICIDSVCTYPGSMWCWQDMTCGLGGDPERPLFVDKYGSDESHPICITVWENPHPPAYDHIRLGIDSLAAGTIRAEIPFYISRTCPIPNFVTHQTNGFVMTAHGSVSWTYADYADNPILDEWFMYPMQYFWMKHRIDGIPPDSFGVYNSSPSGPPYGMPYTTEEWFFTLYLDIGPGLGEICIDSSGAWDWEDLYCGQGGDRERPLFLAKDSSDTDHPICITVFESQCGDMNVDWAIDIDDIVLLLQYVFVDDPITITVGKADVDCSGAIDIDDIVYLLNYVFGTGPEPCADCP